MQIPMIVLLVHHLPQCSKSKVTEKCHTKVKLYNNAIIPILVTVVIVKDHFTSVALTYRLMVWSVFSSKPFVCG